MQRLKISSFNLQHSLECGQAFRWEKKQNGFYYGLIKNIPVKIKQEGASLLYDSYETKIKGAQIRDYLALDLNLSGILSSISKDANIARAAAKYPGLRILRQEPWETLASYIIATFSNIPRIKKCINALSQKFGNEIEFDGMQFFTFPTIDALANCRERHLQLCALGYRSAYLLKTAKMLRKKIERENFDLNALKKLPYAEAKAALMQFPGVGEKVADCVLLFSLGFMEAFPVDVWIKRAMQEMYFSSKPTSIGKIHEFAQGHFGKYAGYAQEYLFYSCRLLE
ncbi:MAG: hypothetical protein HYW05_03120 [Candidatus Diapherotrites archaeon]|nr:hypothetical protein [Candidatus Diapherotrites archaeon]